jgi:VWFA-related protein
MTGRGLPLACVLGVALGLGVEAQQPSFRATTEVVVVDVSVVGKDGAPVTGLQESDFSVKIGGQPRRVRSLKFVDQSVVTPAAGGPGGAGRISSNASETTGRLVLIVVDEASIAFGGLRAAAESVDRLLAGFGPTDKIGLVSLPGPRELVGFTREHTLIVEAVKRIPAGAWGRAIDANVAVNAGEAFALERGDPVVREAVVTRECEGTSGSARMMCAQEVATAGHSLVMEERNRTGQFVGSMRGLLQGLTAVDAPKLVIVFSEGFADPDAASQMAACGGLAAAARATIFAMRLDRSMFDASTRRAPVFSMATLDERTWSTAALDALAGAARGTTLDIVGSAEIPFTRLARELSGYYLVGVEGDASDTDGKLRAIQVEVRRPGVTVRARREVLAGRVVKDERKLLAQVLGSPLTVPDIPLRVATFNMADDDPSRVRILIVGEVDREPPGEPPATVAVIFTDDKGKTTGDTAQKMALSAAPSGALSLMLSTVLPAGEYTMKLALVRAGRAGSVEHRLAARLTQPPPAGGQPGSLRLGDLLVATPVLADRLTSALHGRVSGDRIVAFVQVGFGNVQPKDLSFAFDVVKEEAGPPLVSAVGTVEAQGKGQTRMAEAVVDARLLPPGEYGVRLSVVAAGKPVASLFTPFSLERPPRAAVAAPMPPATGRRPARSTTAPVGRDAARFERADVLEPLVLAPFLEEVARVSLQASRPALELARSGRLDEAVSALEPGKAGDPALPFLRGLAHFARGDLQPASNQFRAAIAEAPELFVGAFYIGACYAAGGKDTQAIGAWQTSLVGLGRYPAVYRFLGDALVRTGQADRARKLLVDAAGRWPDDESLRTRAVRATVEAGEYQQALDYADRLIAAQPSDSSVLFLAMRSAFQALLEDADIAPAALLERLTRYRDLYVAAGGLQQALVEEWVRFAQARARER